MTDSEPCEDRRQQPKPPKPQFLSAQTAAKKLGISRFALIRLMEKHDLKKR